MASEAVYGARVYGNTALDRGFNAVRDPAAILPGSLICAKPTSRLPDHHVFLAANCLLPHEDGRFYATRLRSPLDSSARDLWHLGLVRRVAMRPGDAEAFVNDDGGERLEALVKREVSDLFAEQRIGGGDAVSLVGTVYEKMFADWYGIVLSPRAPVQLSIRALEQHDARLVPPHEVLAQPERFTDWSLMVAAAMPMMPTPIATSK